MTVRAHLNGSPIDLQILADLFPTGDVRVVPEGGRVYLEATALDPCFNESGKLHREAGRILTGLLGAARHLDGSIRAVSLAGRYDRGSTSRIVVGDSFTFRDRQTVVEIGRAADGRGRANPVTVAINGVVTIPQPRGPQLLALMEAHPAVRELMNLLGSSDGLSGPEGPSWPELFNLFEIVRDAVGGEKGLEALGFAKPRISLFRRTSQPYRHARQSGSPPKVPMSRAEGEQFVKEITDAWLAMLAK